MDKGDKRRSFPARTAAWDDVRRFVAEQARALALSRAASLRLELIAEELFINAAEHGHRNDGRPIVVGLDEAGEQVVLTVEDGAAEFNPFADLGEPSASSNPEERPVGGLGRNLVVGLASRCDYRRLESGNCVSVSVLKAPPARR